MLSNDEEIDKKEEKEIEPTTIEVTNENGEKVEITLSEEDLVETITHLVLLAKKLHYYDSFAGDAILDIIQLMLSKNDEFAETVQKENFNIKNIPFDVRKLFTAGRYISSRTYRCGGSSSGSVEDKYSCNCSDENDNNISPDIPENVKNEVDDIINDIRKKLDNIS